MGLGLVGMGCEFTNCTQIKLELYTNLTAAGYKKRPGKFARDLRRNAQKGDVQSPVFCLDFLSYCESCFESKDFFFTCHYTTIPTLVVG